MYLLVKNHAGQERIWKPLTEELWLIRDFHKLIRPTHGSVATLSASRTGLASCIYSISPAQQRLTEPGYASSMQRKSGLFTGAAPDGTPVTY